MDISIFKDRYSAFTLFSRGYLPRESEMTKNERFNLSAGDSHGSMGVNLSFLAMAMVVGILKKISP